MNKYMQNYLDKYNKYKKKYFNLKSSSTKGGNKTLYHGSFVKFDVGEPKLTARIGTTDEPERIKYKGYSFHVTPEKYVALAYLYDKQNMEYGVNMGISLYNKNHEVYIYGPTTLEDALETLYGKGGYLYHFDDNDWFVWFHGLGKLEKITFNPVKPVKRDFIKDPVKMMKDEGVKFVFEKVE